MYLKKNAARIKNKLKCTSIFYINVTFICNTYKNEKKIIKKRLFTGKKISACHSTTYT